MQTKNPNSGGLNADDTGLRGAFAADSKGMLLASPWVATAIRKVTAAECTIPLSSLAWCRKMSKLRTWTNGRKACTWLYQHPLGSGAMYRNARAVLPGPLSIGPPHPNPGALRRNGPGGGFESLVSNPGLRRPGVSSTVTQRPRCQGWIKNRAEIPYSVSIKR